MFLAQETPAIGEFDPETTISLDGWRPEDLEQGG